MNFIICGGGSGGHVSPAISIYEAIKDRAPMSKVTFVGREGGNENKAYIDTGESVVCLGMSGINGKSPLKMASGIISAVAALKKGKEIIRSRTPSVVIGTGGYVSWPMLTAAQRMKIPTVIHESNAYPGLTTRLVSKKADLVLLNYDEARSRIKTNGKICVVGNPLRKDFFATARRSARRKLGIREGDFFILSFGGSLGSERLNQTVISLMKGYSSKSANIKHLHATGRSYYDTLSEAEKSISSVKGGCMILPYIDFMAEAMHAADLVICRCGAMTLAEICSVGVASILIPSPNVSDDHQLKNGAFLARQNAAVLLRESELTERSLEDTVRYLETNEKERLALAANAKSLSSENVAKRIADMVFALAAK